jgi:DNA-binding NarL/FixJ family response regulator
MMSPITVVVVDDHPIFRQGVVNSLSLSPDIQVVGQAGSGERALELIRRLTPDVSILDINLPGINGQHVTHTLRTERNPTRVILLTAYDDLEQMRHAIRAGARAYCSKDVRPEFLLEVIHQVMEGNYVIRDQVMSPRELEQWVEKFTLQAIRTYGDPGEPFSPLSPREMEVLTLVTRGYSNKEIALQLGIGHQTVKNHVTAILRKLRVEDRTQAAVFALRQGWVRLDQQDQ